MKSPPTGAPNRWGTCKLAIFDQHLAISQKQCNGHRPIVAMEHSYALYRMALFPVNLSDLKGGV